MAIIVGIMMLSFFVNSWMMIHFGIKPVSGGRPPRDIKVTRIAVTINGVLFHICDRDSVVVVVCCISIINMGIVRKI